VVDIGVVARLRDPDDFDRRRVATFVHAYPGTEYRMLESEFMMSLAKVIDCVHDLVEDGYLTRDGAALYPSDRWAP